MANEKDIHAPRNPDFDKPLIEMRDLLRRIEATYFADTVDEVLGQLRTGPQKAVARLLGVDFWGGAGSFFDLFFCRENGHVSDDFGRDNRAYCGMLLRLLENLEAEGYRAYKHEGRSEFLRRQSQ